MVRQQPEFIYRETARHLITRPFRWFHYPLALSFHKDINSPTRWLVRVNALPRGTPRRFIEIRIRKSGRGGGGQGKKGREIFEKIRCCSSVNSCELNDPSLLSFWRGGEGFRKNLFVATGSDDVDRAKLGRKLDRIGRPARYHVQLTSDIVRISRKRRIMLLITSPL